MKFSTMIVIVFIAAACVAIIPNILNVHPPVPTTPPSYINNFLRVENEFGVGNKDIAPHYVMFHILPEREGWSVVAWASDSLPPESGITDNKSEIALQLLGTVKYNVLVGDNKCSYYIYPSEDKYDLECDK